jgi:hypothetical protein
MQTRGAGGHDHPIDCLLFNIILNQFLTGIRAHEHVGVNGRYARDPSDLISELLNIDVV